MSIFFGTLIFYGIADGTFAFEHVSTVVITALTALIPGVLIFYLFNYTYGQKL